MPPEDTATERLTREDAGYHKSLKNRQLQMIALGGAIGTGLFLGAGGRLAAGGPGLFIVYGICGIFVFLILRALGELVLHRASSGSFVSYAREFFGEKVAFAAGWMYFLNWAMTGSVDTTAIATYIHYWKAFASIPQWTLALIALVVVTSMNLISVKVFGELEFWASLIKVLALVTFLVVGTVFLAGRFKIDGRDTGPGLWSSHGGLLPTGLLPLVLVTSGVVFAYAAVELIGIAAGETAASADSKRILFPSAYVLSGDTLDFETNDADKDDYTQNCVGGPANGIQWEQWQAHNNGQNVLFADGHAKWYSGYNTNEMTFRYESIHGWE